MMCSNYDFPKIYSVNTMGSAELAEPEVDRTVFGFYFDFKEL